LLTALSTHPGTRTFHLHVLITSPRKSNGLFPYATPRPPRVYVQDVLVLVSEERRNKEPPRILIFALEATLYLIPPTSTLLLYISKLDTSGYTSPLLPPPTSLLTRAFLSYYFNPSTRPREFCTPEAPVRNVWIQLFARAPPLLEKQYLFAGSGEYAGKVGRWRGDRGLCVWWRRVLGRVVEEYVPGGGGGEKEKVGMYYLLPGYNREEAEDALRIASVASLSSSSKSGVQWTYGHPYPPSSHTIPLPCPYDPSDPDSASNLGRYIPYFDDCPKSRFMDEIAYATEVDVKSPQRKKRKGDPSEEREKKDKDKDKKLRPLGEMGRVSADEFWERMSFRQECVSGAVTGFFTIFISSPPSVATSSAVISPSPLQPQPGQVSSQINKRVLTTLLTGVEFSDVDKAIKGTEIVEGTIKSLCEGRSVASAGANALARTILARERAKTPEREERYLRVPRTPPRHGHMAEVSPNPFCEPVVTADTYGRYIYGRSDTRNAVRGASGTQPGGEEHVTVLAVRKKKRK
ncbi:histone acetylation protein-domain-containing protein, partial [Crepidotus variabilis]